MNKKLKFSIYNSPEEEVKIDVVVKDLYELVELYQSSKSNISEHIKHIFEEGELSENSVVRKFRTTATDGKDYNISYYNLDMIISLGYRIKSSYNPFSLLRKCNTA